MTEDEMAGWHHRLDGREFERTLGVGDGQGGLACCNSWGLKESDMTKRLAITMTFTSKPTVREVFQLDFQMGKYFAFVEDESISGPTCIRFHYHPIFMPLM